MRKILFAIALFFQPLPVWAAAPAACPAMDRALPAPLAGWTKPVPLTAATHADALEEAVLTLGHSAVVWDEIQTEIAQSTSSANTRRQPPGWSGVPSGRRKNAP